MPCPARNAFNSELRYDINQERAAVQKFSYSKQRKNTQTK
ncbi:hypothetical protein SALWKB29_1396 [Snodgrassella communis]|uniref:Uncharacterized protein n=1 Tax=Snodgrassella communis TaxID=2946699 RepID=A0A836Z500_9NEIS|nr:hypothetical protein SALWKB29_1396 [Snodgrassella communis]